MRKLFIDISDVMKRQLTIVNKKDIIKIIWKRIMEASLSKVEMINCIQRLINCDITGININKNNKFVIQIESNEYDISSKHIENAVKKCLFSSLRTMKNLITRREIFFIDKKSNIPLVGSIYFGLIDRGTNLIQVRPITGCTLNCIYCSVDEGPFSKTRILDYLVEKDYLLEQFQAIAEYKKIDNIEAHIDGQGEPTLYPYLVELISALKNIDSVSIVSMQTNGITLSKKFIDKLIKAGIDRINVSINAINPLVAKNMANVVNYNVNTILNNLRYANEQGLHILLAPVWIKNYNDEDIKKIIFYAKKHIKPIRKWPILGIQNYEVYRFGRKARVGKVISFKDFYKNLKLLEEECNISPLILSAHHFGIQKAKHLPIPFKKYSVVPVDSFFPGRFRNEIMGITKGRVIHIRNIKKKTLKTKKVRLLHVRHNIYFGRLAKS